MASTPYRISSHLGETTKPAESRPHLDLVTVAGLAWIVTILRIVAALTRGEAPSREVDIAWLLLFVAPVVIWQELKLQRSRR